MNFNTEYPSIPNWRQDREAIEGRGAPHATGPHRCSVVLDHKTHPILTNFNFAPLSVILVASAVLNLKVNTIPAQMYKVVRRNICLLELSSVLSVTCFCSSQVKLWLWTDPKAGTDLPFISLTVIIDPLVRQSWGADNYPHNYRPLLCGWWYPVREVQNQVTV